MSIPTTLKFGAGVAYLGDGADPEVLAKLCGFTKGELTFSKETKDNSVPDCADPDAPIWKTTDVTGMGWSIKYEGFATPASLPLIEAAMMSSTSRMLRHYLKGAGAGGASGPDRLYEGRAHVTLSLNGQLGERWQISVEATGDGPLAISSTTIPTS